MKDSQEIELTSEAGAAEEIANVVTHALGVVLSCVGLYALIEHALPSNNAWQIVSYVIFGVSLVALYLASTLYHAARCPNKKAKLKTLDHCAIYFLIAGSYTPFLLVSMRESVGWPMFFAVWGIAAFGIFLKLRFKHRFQVLRVLTYLVMGWLVVFAGKDLLDALPEAGLQLLLAGGIVYTLGVVFYLVERIPYNHAIWHLFVMGGSICHFFSIYYYVSPATLST